MKYAVLIAAILASATPAFAQSCEEQRDLYRTLIEQLRGQRAVTEVDTAQALMEARREAARLRAELAAAKAKPAEQKPSEQKPEAPKVEQP